jgi:hypothetical protein
MTTGPAFEATTHLVAHLLRDIESALRDVLRPGPKPQGHRADIESILGAFDIHAADHAAVAWLRLSDQRHDERLAPFAHRDSLRAPRRFDEAFRRFVGDVEAIFDVVLERFEGRFLSLLPSINTLLEKANPTAADVRALRGTVPENFITYEYFFGKVEAPGWLDLLAADGFFNDPPHPVPDEETAGVRIPAWPHSRYLVRMATNPALQRRVVEIALAIPETENDNIHDDLARVALAVPASLAVRFLPKIKQWLKARYQLRLAHRIGELVAHLVTGGEVDAAVELAAAFLTIRPDPEVHEVTVGEQTHRLPPHPRTEQDEWLVERFFDQTLPTVVQYAGIRALELVCQALNDVVRLSQADPEKQAPQDYSTIWRRAIEDHEANLSHEVKSTFVTAVRRAAEQLITRDPALLSEVGDVLESYRWSIFNRIALHVLIDAPAEFALPLIEQRLIDKERFSDGSQRREYMALAERWFAKVSSPAQETILGWIGEGPDLEPHKRFRMEMEGREPTDAELAEYADRWRLDRLRVLRDALPPKWGEVYKQLVERYGEPEMPDFTGVRMPRVMHGSESPMTPTELGQMPVTEIVSRLKTWQPTGGFRDPSPEGLRRALQTAVDEEPARFADEAASFKDVEPTYVRGLMDGLQDAVNKKRPFSWAPVLKLCQRIVNEPIGPADGGGPFELDRGWRWTRKAIGDLIEDALRIEPCPIPFTLRDEVWQLIRRLVDEQELLRNRRRARPTLSLPQWRLTRHAALRCTRRSAMPCG